MRADTLKFIGFSLLLHAAIASLFLFSLSLTPDRAQSIEQPIEAPIQAVAVSEQAVLQEIENQKQKEATARAAEARRQQELQAQERSARQAREREEQRLAELEKQRQENQRQQQAEQQQLAKLQEQQRQEQQQLQKLQAEKKAAEEARRKEQAKLEQERKAREDAELKRKAEEKRRAEEDRKRKAEEEKRKAEAERKRNAELDRQRTEADRRRQEEIAQEELGRKIRSAATTFSAAVQNAVNRTWLRPAGAPTGLESVVEIRLALDGTVLDVRTTRSSGSAVFDRSAESAIRKASPLPMPRDPEVAREFQRQGISFTFRPST